MRTFDTYLIRHLAIATVVIGFALAGVIFLTQSLKFLELVIEAGASSMSFWALSFLALPRFLEVILPLALMAGVLFIYNRMVMDLELIVARAAGMSTMALARPAVIVATILCVVMLFITLWGAPKSLSTMKQMQQVVRAQFSNLLFREGVFNQVGSGLMLYIREREGAGELRGLLIHDSREADVLPSTIIAQSGQVISNEDGYQVTVFDGARHQYNHESGILQRLNFDSYKIELPASDKVNVRWREPEERTIVELLNPDLQNRYDAKNLREFQVEIHRRFTSPLMSLALCFVGLSALLLGPVNRRGQGKRIMMAVGAAFMIQGGYLSAFNIARDSNVGLVMMYGCVLLPLIILPFLFSAAGEKLRRSLFYKPQNNEAAS